MPQEQMSKTGNNSPRESAAGSDSSKKMLKAVVDGVKKTLAKHVDASKKKPLASSSNDALVDVSTNKKHITGVLREKQRRVRGKTRRASLSNDEEQTMEETENDVLSKQDTQHMTPITNAVEEEKKSAVQGTEVVDTEVENMVHETKDLNEKRECLINEEGSKTTGDASKVFMETKEEEKEKETDTDEEDECIAKRVGRRLRALRNAENNTAAKTQELTNGGSAVVTRKTINKRNQRAKKELECMTKIDILVQEVFFIQWALDNVSRALLKMMNSLEEQNLMKEIIKLETTVTVLLKIMDRMENLKTGSQTPSNVVENVSKKKEKTQIMESNIVERMNGLKKSLEKVIN